LTACILKPILNGFEINNILKGSWFINKNMYEPKAYQSYLAEILVIPVIKDYQTALKQMQILFV